MIGFLIMGHNKFGSLMVSSCNMICGPSQNIETIDFLPDYDNDMLDKKIDDALSRLDKSQGVIALCDIAGGSPFNRIMIKAATEEALNIHVVAGLNLGMLIEALNLRQEEGSINILVENLINAGKESIVYGNELLKKAINDASQ